MLIIHCGMDNTLVNWKEDFNMTFLDGIPSQKEAVQYLEAMAAAYPKRRIILYEQPKGGNLAAYAGAFCYTAVQRRILQVYNHDGPGFSAETLKTADYRSIAQRIETFVHKPVSSEC